MTREYFDVGPQAHHRIPYGRARLSCYRFTNPASRGTIVLFGGFDSYVEELFPMQRYPCDAGFDVIRFDGPGQGATLEEEHRSMTPDREISVDTVLDLVSALRELPGGSRRLRIRWTRPRGVRRNWSFRSRGRMGFRR